MIQINFKKSPLNMFFGKFNKTEIIKYLLAAMILAALNPGCSIQGFIAKKVLTSVGKKVYHGIKDQNERQKESKARDRKHKPVTNEEPE
jgi:hypothetical protein